MVLQLIKRVSVGNMALSVATLLVAVGSVGVYGDTVYKTVDAEGLVSYTDVKPEVDSLQVEEIQLPDHPEREDSAAGQQSLEKAREVADLLMQDRLARESLRIKRLAAEKSVSSSYQEPQIDGQYYYPSPSHHHLRRFPFIHQRPRHPDSVVPLRRTDQQKDSGPLIVPKSRLLTP